MPIVRVSDPDDVLLADYRSLNDQPFRRRLEGDTFFMAEGYVAIDRLVDSGHRIRSVLLAPSRLSRFEPHLERLDREGVPVLVAERTLISQTVGFDLHRGVIASAQRRGHPDIATLARSSRRLAVLEGLNDAENLGVIARAARAFGIDGLVIDSTCTDPYSRRTVRVSMGEVLMLPIARAGEEALADVLTRLEALGYHTWAMTPSADADDLWTLEVPDRVAVVFGAEGPGLAPRTLAAARRRVRIPIRPEVDSLNVGHAAAVAFAAVTRP